MSAVVEVKSIFRVKYDCEGLWVTTGHLRQGSPVVCIPNADGTPRTPAVEGHKLGASRRNTTDGCEYPDWYGPSWILMGKLPYLQGVLEPLLKATDRDLIFERGTKNDGVIGGNREEFLSKD